jgi:flagellar FliL protein
MGMSDQQEQGSDVQAEVKPKKKGKLPVLIALVLVLGAGGYFGFKMRTGAAKAAPKIALGEIVPLTEFLVNLQDGDVYLRTEIALHLRTGFAKEGLDKNLPAVRDAILLLLSSKSLNQIGTTQGKEQLKKDIATAVNKLLEPGEPPSKESGESGPHPAPEQAQPNPGKQPPSGPARPTAGKPASASSAKAAPEHPEWQSQTGPVLKVYFTSFATQ